MRVAVALLCGAVACASYPPPHMHLAKAAAIASVADELGAGKLTKAALHVQLAREEIAKASALLGAGENEKADYMTLRAYHDAELAIALIHEESVRVRFESAQVQARAQGVATH